MKNHTLYQSVSSYLPESFISYSSGERGGLPVPREQGGLSGVSVAVLRVTGPSPGELLVF